MQESHENTLKAWQSVSGKCPVESRIIYKRKKESG